MGKRLFFILASLVTLCLIVSACTETVKQTATGTTPLAQTNIAPITTPTTPTTPENKTLAGPYTHRIESAYSSDGLNWTRDTGIRLEHASVPCAVSDGNRILLYYVDADRGAGQPESVGCSISTDGLHFQKQPFVINGLTAFKALDPCVLRSADGKYRLYYLAGNKNDDPATEGQSHEIDMAISDDGIHFNNVGAVFHYPGLVDPDVFVFNNTWFMYVFSKNQTIIATSEDGNSFSYRQTLALQGWGTVAPIQLEDGRLRLYAFEQSRASGNAVHSFVSSNGFDWTQEKGDRLIAAADEQITDPYVVRWKDGYKMFFKIENRTQSGNQLPSQPSVTPLPNSDGPWNHRVLLAASDDGMSWHVTDELQIEQASVPELFLGPNNLPILIFVDASGQSAGGGLGVMVKQPDGSWIRESTNLSGADPNIVRLKDGSYRAYTKEKNWDILVFSSRDGLDLQKLGIAFQDSRYPEATDPDVFETHSGWVMLISLGPRLLRCTSTDGIKFTAGEVMDLGGSVSDTVAVDGGWRTFFHVNANPQTGSKMIIRSAFTADGSTWKIDDGVRLSAPTSGPAQLGVADPAPLKLNNGTWLMAIKSFIK